MPGIYFIERAIMEVLLYVSLVHKIQTRAMYARQGERYRERSREEETPGTKKVLNGQPILFLAKRRYLEKKIPWSRRFTRYTFEVALV